MINPLDTKLLAFIGRNRYTFMLVVLLVGNVYQYIDNKSLVAMCSQEKKDLNQKIIDMQTEATQYERQRSEKLEFLLNSLNARDNGGNNKTR